MKRISLILLFCLISVNIAAAPRVKIVSEYITPNMLAANSSFTGDSTVGCQSNSNDTEQGRQARASPAAPSEVAAR